MNSSTALEGSLRNFFGFVMVQLFVELTLKIEDLLPLRFNNKDTIPQTVLTLSPLLPLSRHFRQAVGSMLYSFRGWKTQASGSGVNELIMCIPLLLFLPIEIGSTLLALSITDVDTTTAVRL
jgi:hypothetical protein